MSRFTDKMFHSAMTSSKGMVTGEPVEPVRYTWREVHEQARRIAGGLYAAHALRKAPVNITLLAFDRLNGGMGDGNVFALYIIAVAAAEVGVGLAMVLLIYRNRKSIALDELSEMKG